MILNVYKPRVLISINVTDSDITFSVTYAKGTCIRVLAKNIAERLGTIGHLHSLIRTKVGSFSVDESKTIDNFKTLWKSYEH